MDLMLKGYLDSFVSSYDLQDATEDVQFEHFCIYCVAGQMYCGAIDDVIDLQTGRGLVAKQIQFG